jgi:hypothetical protein
VDLDTLAKLGEFVGGFFVVVSLVYLAHQVRQNTKSLQTENYARVLDRMSTLQSRLSVDAELNRLVVIGAEDPGRLSRMERIRFSWALYELFGAGEFMFHQARAAALPRAVWERWEATIRWWASHPGMQAWLQSKPTALATDFEEFLREIIRNRRWDDGGIDRWRAFVAGEGLPKLPEPVAAHAEPKRTGR